MSPEGVRSRVGQPLSQLTPRAYSVDYRALMACSQTGAWLGAVEDQLASWLRTKKSWELDARVDGRYTDGRRELEIRHHRGSHSRNIQARLVEQDTPQGTWTTELLVHERIEGGGWISVDVENDRGRFVDVPWLAKYLMQVLPLSDGTLHLVDEPQIFRAHQVDEVIDLLCDEQRHGLVFMAGTDHAGIPFDPFVAAVRRWTGQVFGLAQVIVLDPDATQGLAAAFGLHSVRPWSMRTYLPGVDPASSIDARRHRYLATQSLAELSDGRVRKVLGTAARTHAAGRPIPAHVQKVRRLFERLANQAIVEAIAKVDQSTAISDAHAVEPISARTSSAASASPGAALTAERLHEQVELVRSILGVDSLDETTLRRFAASALAPRADPAAVARVAEQIRAQQARMEMLEDTVSLLTRALDEEQIEHAVTAEALEKRDDEARWLRGQLQEQGSYEVAFAELPPESETVYPESFGELLEKMAAMREQGVIFTGNPDHATALDDVDLLGKCRHTAWEAILTLADYVRARSNGVFGHGIDQYIKQTPSGYRQIAPSKFAPTETAVTMQRYGSERIFPVPPEVDPQGRATMSAHFKLGRIGMVSPRLYYLDDYTRTGLIVIGYIGPHLTNTQTN